LKANVSLLSQFSWKASDLQLQNTCAVFAARDGVTSLITWHRWRWTAVAGAWTVLPVGVLLRHRGRRGRVQGRRSSTGCAGPWFYCVRGTTRPSRRPRAGPWSRDEPWGSSLCQPPRPLPTSFTSISSIVRHHHRSPV